MMLSRHRGPCLRYLYTRCGRQVTRLIFYLPKFLFFQCYPLDNSSLGQLNTDGDIVPVLVAALSFTLFWKSLIKMSLKGRKGSFACNQTLQTNGCPLSHRPLRHRVFDFKSHSCGSPAPIHLTSAPVTFSFFVTNKFLQMTSFLDFRKHPKKCNGHAKDHTGCRFPALLPKVGTTSPSVCSCPRELF